MTDREQLELAAKAAGMETKIERSTGQVRSRVPNSGLAFPVWNPLTDDGDALRLMVRLKLAVRQDDKAAISAGWSANQTGAPTHDGKGPWFWKEWINGEDHNNGDANAATRRAIVSAAAELGKAM